MQSLQFIPHQSDFAAHISHSPLSNNANEKICRLFTWIPCIEIRIYFKNITIYQNRSKYSRSFTIQLRASPFMQHTTYHRVASLTPPGSLQRKCVWYQRNISVSIQAVTILKYTQSTHNICRIHISFTAYLSYWMHYYISKSLYLPRAAPIKSQSSRRSPFIWVYTKHSIVFSNTTVFRL